jgi:mRNA interferase MazF
VVIVPVGSTSYGLRSHVEIAPGHSLVDHPSYARCDQLRVNSTERVVAKRGAATVDEVHAINQSLRFILDL